MAPKQPWVVFINLNFPMCSCPHTRTHSKTHSHYTHYTHTHSYTHSLSLSLSVAQVRELYVMVEDTQQLQDEVDEWRQKGISLEQTQRELARCKEKLEDQDYLLHRIEV